MDVLTKNINKVHEKQLSLSDRFALTIASFAGRMLFVVVHTLWFILWFVLRLDINLLTLIVSLEAIYLSTFIMINQNQQDKKNRIELDHDYEINRQAELEIQELHSKIDKLQQKVV